MAAYSEWYVELEGEIYGPLPSRDLRGLVASGAVTPNTRVSPDRIRWQAAGTIQGLTFESRPTAAIRRPPPLPARPPRPPWGWWATACVIGAMSWGHLMVLSFPSARQTILDPIYLLCGCFSLLIILTGAGFGITTLVHRIADWRRPVRPAKRLKIIMFVGFLFVTGDTLRILLQSQQELVEAASASGGVLVTADGLWQLDISPGWIPQQEADETGPGDGLHYFAPARQLELLAYTAWRTDRPEATAEAYAATLEQHLAGRGHTPAVLSRRPVRTASGVAAQRIVSYVQQGETYLSVVSVLSTRDAYGVLCISGPEAFVRTHAAERDAIIRSFRPNSGGKPGGGSRLP